MLLLYRNQGKESDSKGHKKSLHRKWTILSQKFGINAAANKFKQQRPTTVRQMIVLSNLPIKKIEVVYLEITENTWSQRSQQAPPETPQDELV